MEKIDIEKTIQALLFATDKPLSAAILAQVVEIPHKQVVASIESINERLKEQASPISIKQIAGGYEFLTMPEYSPYIKKLYKNRFMTRLSRPALEVLSIVSYKQPISKQEVETIRGVNSDGVYYTLLERKLIKIVGRKDAPGRPLLYGTTRDFLQYLGINSLDDLPKLEEVQSILEKDEHLESWEERVEVAKNQTMLHFDEGEKARLMERSKSVTEEEMQEVIDGDDENEDAEGTSDEIGKDITDTGFDDKIKATVGEEDDEDPPSPRLRRTSEDEDMDMDEEDDDDDNDDMDIDDDED